MRENTPTSIEEYIWLITVVPITTLCMLYVYLSKTKKFIQTNTSYDYVTVSMMPEYMV